MAIPASDIVSITPNVLSAGGDNLVLKGLMLTNSARVPVGSVLAFGGTAAVSSYFGASSTEATYAPNYFNGFDNSNKKPSSLLFAQYPTADVSAWLRGASMSAITLTELKTYTGTLTIVIDGYTWTSASITLSPATSFSAAATIIQTALQTTPPTAAVVTASIADTTMTVTAVASGTLAVGQTVTGTGVTAGTIITALGTGIGEEGTYTVSETQTVSSGTLTMTGTKPIVTFDSTSYSFVITSGITGAASTIDFPTTATLATNLKLTSVLGAVTSQGAIAAVPATFMTNLFRTVQNFGSFMTLFDPDGSGNTLKLAFADWTNDQNKQVAYACWDTDVLPTLSATATTSLGYILAASNSDGTIPIYAPTAAQGIELASFILGAIASIDPDELNGRTTLCFRSQAGITASVDDQTTANNLIANGYNYYGIHATRADAYTFFRPGSITGSHEWIDSYVNQMMLSDRFQVSYMDLLTAMKSIPYNNPGYNLVRAAAQDPINWGLRFGAIRAGVSMSALQKAEVQDAAGKDVSAQLFNQGYYLMITDASVPTRGLRDSPPIKFWYMDGQSIQSIDMTSILIQ